MVAIFKSIWNWVAVKKIVVNVEGNEVTLTGPVRSFNEKDNAENTAWAAPVVLHVDSKLRIDAPEYAFYE